MLLKKFNMDITEKMVSFQIIQNVLILKRTLVGPYLLRINVILGTTWTTVSSVVL